MDCDNMELGAEFWCRKILDKSSSFSEFLLSQRSLVTSGISEESDNALKKIEVVIRKLPDGFFQNEVPLLLDFFIDCLDLSSLTALSTIQYLIVDINAIPSRYEEVIVRTLYKERNLQSWPQKERQHLYEILHWLLKNKMPILRVMGNDFLEVFIKSVSGERDPRCLVHMFSAFLEVAVHFDLGSFTEEMFETVVCYFPVEFKPQPGDTVTREYLAATCASCLTASSSFAPWCLLLIDEKLNDEQCGEQEYSDILDLLKLSCASFEKGQIVKFIEPLVNGVRKLALDPQMKATLSERIKESLCAMFTICGHFENSAEVDKVVKSILEDTEPFVVQAEMGLTRMALEIMQCAYEHLDRVNGEKVLRQVIAWVLHLVNGDTINVSNNKPEIVEEALQYLVVWIELASKNNDFLTLRFFEDNVFSSCSLAREMKPIESLKAIYEISTIFLQNEQISPELISVCHLHIETELSTPVDSSTFESYLNLIRSFSVKCPDKIERVVKSCSMTLNAEKSLPVMCAIGCSSSSWDLLESTLAVELARNLSLKQETLDRYVRMMEMCRLDTELVKKQFYALENAILKAEHVHENAPLALQSAARILSNNDHKQFIDRITQRFAESTTTEISSMEHKFGLSYLQNKNVDQLVRTTQLNFNCHTRQQFMFAACNRRPNQEVSTKYSITKLKANVLANSAGSLKNLDHFFSNASVSNRTSFINDSKYLCNFESPDADPDKCLYETSSPLWRQRMFFQMTQSYSHNFFRENSDKDVLVEFLPFLMRFAAALDMKLLKQQFSTLAPVVFYALNRNREISAIITSTVPLFLEVSENLVPADLHLIVAYLSSAIKENFFDLDVMEGSLNSLSILAKKHGKGVLVPEVSTVLKSVNKILGHRKRFLRILASNVKNIWEKKVAE